MDVQDLARLLKKSSVGHAADYLRSHAAIASLLDQAVGAGGYRPSSPRSRTSYAKSREGSRGRSVHALPAHPSRYAGGSAHDHASFSAPASSAVSMNVPVRWRCS